MKSVYGRISLALTMVASLAILGFNHPSSAAPQLDVAGRLLDSRAGGTTVDGQYAGFGMAADGDRIWLQVAGRGGVPDDARSVALNVTAVNGRRVGFVTVDDCAQQVPFTSNLNFSAGQTVANMAITELNDNGMACFFTSGGTDLIVDVAATFPSRDFTAVDPGRLLDTRGNGPTVDGKGQGAGTLQANRSIQVDVVGRQGVPNRADQVIVNLTSTRASDNGFLTVHDCNDPVGETSNLNFRAGQNVAGMTVVDPAADGSFCVYSSTATDVVVDVFGYFDNNAFTAVDPARLVETRSNLTTEDGKQQGIGRLSGGQTIDIDIASRGGVPGNANAVMLQVATVAQAGSGFVTVYTPGNDRPTASNVNFAPGAAVGNSVIVELGGAGNVCLFTDTAAHVVVDVIGYFSGPKATSSNTSCPTAIAQPPGGGGGGGGGTTGGSTGGTTGGSTGGGTTGGSTGGGGGTGGSGSGAYPIPARGPISAGTILRNQAGGAGPSGDGTGNFRLVCGYSHMGYNDPIVAPGQTGGSHLHTFFGNTGTDANSTYESLRTSGNSTCDGGTANRSAYWIPALINGNRAMAPDLFFVYYKSGYRAVQPQEINNIPNGLRIVAGSAGSSRAQSGEIIRWYCNGSGGGGTIPNCGAGSELRLDVTFPQCWNGRDLDSADHKSHMAYPGSGAQFGQGCPSSHPVELPVITMNTVWTVPSGGTGSLFLSSDVTAGGPAGSSAHADFFEAWDPEIRNTFTQRCIRTGWDCGVRLLGDGTMLTILSSVPGLPRAVAPMAVDSNVPVRLGGALPDRSKMVLPPRGADGKFFCSL